MVNRAEDREKTKMLISAHILKKDQDKAKGKYEILKSTSVKYFQSVYVRLQAEEICRYIKEMQITPLNPWYSKLLELISEGTFMSQFYLTYNDFGQIEPDYKKIETLILPDPDPDDMPRSITF